MLTLAGISKSYGPRTLFSDVSLFIKREDRLGLVGPNGAGKSTLFNLILGEEAADDGTITWERGADFGYLPQETAPAGEETILDLATAITPEFVAVRDQLRALEHGAPVSAAVDFDVHHRFEELGGYALETKAKIILAGLGFREADHARAAKTFSGGWVMRAHLARLLVREPSLLLLDEPTNHLDLESITALNNGLNDFRGNVIIASRDHELIQTIANRIIEITPYGIIDKEMTFDEYINSERVAEQKAELIAKAPKMAKVK
jgi:ATP-binding cassette subfamily F protein 3